MIETPYLLYLGSSRDPLAVKTARGIMIWRPDSVVGEVVSAESEMTVGADRMTIEEGAKRGAKTLIIGYANSGGYIEESNLEDIVKALELGLNVASGLHHDLQENALIKEAAERQNCKLHNVRRSDKAFKVGTGTKRPGNRLLTVGTDCSVGKMFTSLAIQKEMEARGENADFRATGQTGIFIAGEGVPVDAVISDFISGSVESLSPAREDGGWDIIEGQGSLFHPAYAGVSLGLLHGAQPDHLILCHEANRAHMRHLPGRSVPELEDCIKANLWAAKVVNPEAHFSGIALNSRNLDKAEADRLCAQLEREFKLPCQDPMRHGVERIVDHVLI
ncbi:EBNA-1 nuclear protein [Litorimonas haliclonae]